MRKLRWYWARANAVYFPHRTIFGALSQKLQIKRPSSDSQNIGELTTPKRVWNRGLRPLGANGTEWHGLTTDFLLEFSPERLAVVLNPTLDDLPDCVLARLVEPTLAGGTLGLASGAAAVPLPELLGGTLGLAGSVIEPAELIGGTLGLSGGVVELVPALLGGTLGLSPGVVIAYTAPIEVGGDWGTQGDVDIVEIVDVGGEWGTQGDVDIVEIVDVGGDWGTQGDVNIVVAVGGEWGTQGNATVRLIGGWGTQGDVDIVIPVEVGGDWGTQGDVDV